MKWVLLLFVVALLYPAMSLPWNSNHDYTGKYAELAAPAPSHVNVDDLINNLRAASQ